MITSTTHQAGFLSVPRLLAVALQPVIFLFAPNPSHGYEGESSSRSEIESLFQNPPPEASPSTFWHWMNGHVSREGITADLEAMKRVGIDTPLMFTIGLGLPEGPVGFGTGSYFAMLEHTASEAKRLGLTFGFHNADSWSGSGGPWITPELSMQKLTFSDLRVEGPRHISLPLPKPPHKMDHYRDVAVFAVACPPDATVEDPMVGASLETNAKDANAPALLGPAKEMLEEQAEPLPAGSETVWFEIKLARPTTIRSVEIRGSGGQFPACRILAAKDNGNANQLLRESPPEFWAYGGSNHEVYRFAPVRTSVIRVEFSGSDSFRLTELRVSDLDAVEDWPGKSGWVGFCELDPTGLVRPDLSPAPQVIDPPDPAPRLEGIPGGLRLLAAAPGKFTFTDAGGVEHVAEASAPPDAVTLAGPWNLNFPEGLGAPQSIRLPGLISWTDHPEFGVRHFSGTATYRTTFDMPTDGDPSTGSLRYEIDLGDVRHLAAVRLNGIALGTLWKPPFRCDATSALRPGSNTLEIEVTNLWVNRLIGDEHLPDDCEWNGKTLARIPDWLSEGSARPSGRIAFATYRHWTSDDPLIPSGLLGPVTVRPLRVVDLHHSGQAPSPETSRP